MLILSEAFCEGEKKRMGQFSLILAALNIVAALRGAQ